MWQNLGAHSANTDIVLNINGLFNMNPASVFPNLPGLTAFGFIDNNTGAISQAIAVSNNLLYFEGLGKYGGGAGTDGYNYDLVGTNPPAFPNYSFSVGTTDPLTFFVVEANDTADTSLLDTSAFAVSFDPNLYDTPGVPEIDPCSSANAVAILIAGLCLVSSRCQKSGLAREETA